MIGIVCAFFHTEGKGFYSKDVWKIPEVNNAAKRIVSLDDIEQQKNRPWNNQDIQLYSERK